MSWMKSYSIDVFGIIMIVIMCIENSWFSSEWENYLDLTMWYLNLYRKWRISITWTPGRISWSWYDCHAERGEETHLASNALPISFNNFIFYVRRHILQKSIECWWGFLGPAGQFRLIRVVVISILMHLGRLLKGNAMSRLIAFHVLFLKWGRGSFTVFLFL